MRATRSRATARLRAVGPRRLARLRLVVVRRLLLVLGLAVGGWVVSAVLATTSASAVAGEPADRLDHAALCADDRTGTPSDEDCTAAPADPEDTDAVESPVDEGLDLLPEAEPVDDLPPSAETPSTPAEPAEPANPTNPSNPTDPADPADPADIPQRPDDAREGGDSLADVPEPDTNRRDAVDEPASSTPAEDPTPLGPVRTLLRATTDTLVSTTSGLASTLVHTTEHLGGWLFGALPEVTRPITEPIKDVVEDIPDRLGSAPPLGLLPEPAAPQPPAAPDDVLPDRPSGEPRVDPDAARQSERDGARPHAPAETPDPDAPTDSDSESPTMRSGDSRPLGPVAPSPAAPTSAAAPSHSTASPQDHNHHSYRGDHAVLDDVPTVTQLRLLGASRDHDVVGVGREAALPTTSPD